VNTAHAPAAYRRFLRYPARQWRWIAMILVLSATAAVLAALQPLPLKLLVDNALGDAGSPGWLVAALEAVGAEPTVETLVVVAGLTAATIAIIVALVNVSLDLSWEVAGQRMVYDLAADLFDKLQRLSLLSHRHRPIGDSLSRLTVDSWSIYAATNAAIVAPIVHVLMLVFVGVAAWSLDASMAAVTLALAPALAIAARFFGERLRSRSSEQLASRGRLLGFVQQILPAVPLVQANNAQSRNDARFHSLAGDVISSSKRASITQTLFGSVGGLITTLGRALVIYIGAIRVLDGLMTLGDLLVFIAYLGTLQSAAQGLLSVYSGLKAAQAGLDRALEVFSVEEDVRDPEHPHRWPNHSTGVQGWIRFDEVTFGYDPDVPVLRKIELDARPGEMTALVGRTGSGKSTLVSMIPRFFDPWEGSVSFDGVDLRDLRLTDLRRSVSLLRQDPFLLPITVAENIAYGRPGASMAEIENAAVAANADGFIRDLSDGYETVLGERGDTLSGGQRQRLAIARALLKDAPVLILDEPSSDLDTETEHLLLEALDRLMAERTTFVIAHRLSTVRNADRILVLEDGRIRESGTHAQLLEAKGLYHHLHSIQLAETARA
jgi:ATP-binding cassette subfamily B protein/subfamily B ATP-binding cassette protein MsbA